MTDNYILMHRNEKCGLIGIDRDSNALIHYKPADSACSPYLGHADLRLMKKWWEIRAVPASRDSVRQMLEKAGCESTREFLAKNLALSLSDTYWICPVDLNLTWEDINLYDGMINTEKIPYHNPSSYDPNASLGGQMDKYWDMSHNTPVLVKESYREHGQQCINEAFATLIHERQKTSIPFVSYSVERGRDGGMVSKCPAFTSQDTELVPALEILDSEKLENSLSLYDKYIEIASSHGVDKNAIREALDYQTLTDFIISNTDEHLLNFGMLRDTKTMQFTGPAPIFDSGNSMFFSDHRNTPYKRSELLERKITAFHDREELMLKKVKNKDIVDISKLPTKREAEAFYRDYGIPETKISLITSGYHDKIEMLKEFQQGKTISLYMEKHTS